jgi:hypothetical protein
MSMPCPSTVSVIRAAACLVLVAVGAAPAAAASYCSTTADLMLQACRTEARDDRFVQLAYCTNLADDAARAACESEAERELRRTLRACDEQRDWRGGLCQRLGEARYDPPFTPDRFDPNFGGLSRPNPYFPLTIGHRWEYAGGDETTVVEVVPETRDVAGVTCIVVRDLVYENGLLHEATDDWFAAGLDGSSWYCGEESKDYAWNPGDMPPRAELVSIDGSFKHGRDGAKAGIIMPADPVIGLAYREEFSLGNAEDVGEIVATGWSLGQDPVLDRFVPPALAQRMCKADCVVTRNVSQLSPGVQELKYHARGIGMFLEVDPARGVKLQLVNCSFDPRCVGLARR